MQQQSEVELCNAAGGELHPDARCRFLVDHVERYHSSDGSKITGLEARGYYWYEGNKMEISRVTKFAECKCSCHKDGGTSCGQTCCDAYLKEYPPEVAPAESRRPDPKPEAKAKQIAEEVALPMQYDETGRHNAEKGEEYAEQIIRKGYPKESRDAIATLSAIIFALDEKLSAAAQPKPDAAGDKVTFRNITHQEAAVRAKARMSRHPLNAGEIQESGFYMLCLMEDELAAPRNSALEEMAKTSAKPYDHAAAHQKTADDLEAVEDVAKEMADALELVANREGYCVWCERNRPFHQKHCVVDVALAHFRALGGESKPVIDQDALMLGYGEED